jgi:predicted regulator of Ras-like GTPase activity (Roadblock/LC7/MglB family)
MIEMLEPLAELPGVELVMLVTHDGVPVAVPGRAAKEGEAEANNLVVGKEDGIAACAVGWLNELSHAVAPLSWGDPVRVVLRCARGILVMRRARSAVLMVLLSRGLSPEDVRLSMDGTVARIERSLRGMGRENTTADAGSSAAESKQSPITSDPPGPIPSRTDYPSADKGAEASNLGKRNDFSGN